MRVRLREVALKAGLSESTVSRVVNDRPGVKDETRAMVRKVIDELGYDPPGLHITPGHGFVGLIVPELQNPIFPAFAQAIETDLANHGLTCVLCTADRGGLQEPGYIEVLVERGVAGIVVISGLHANVDVDHGLYRQLLARGMPMVFVNGFVDGLEATFVSADDHHAASSAVRHLISLGHRRIGGVMGPNQFVPVQRRIAGYLDALQSAFGADANPLLVEGYFTVEGGQAAAHDLLDAGCTALVCASDVMALGALRAAAERGLTVPDDVSVVGYDDTMLMEFVHPPLTTVRQPVRAMSATIVHALVERIGGMPIRQREYLFRPELVVRGSIGPAPEAASSMAARS